MEEIESAIDANRIKTSPWPNILSFSRVVISPFIFWAIKENDITLIVVFSAWALLTDFFDGYLARKLKSITNAGKIFDPLADKLCVVAAASAATVYGDMPLLLLIVIVARDLAIAAFGLTIAGKVKKIPVSNLFGKITVTVLSATLVVYVFKIHLLYGAAFWIAILFIVVSSASYLKSGIKIISNKFEY